MAKKLTKLRVTEVSIVDRAANPGARMLMKRDIGELPSPPPIMEEKMSYKPKEVVAIVKRAIETGDAIEFSKQDLFAAAQARADKEIYAPTAASRFAKYAETSDGRAMMAAMKLAPSAPAAPTFTSSYEALEYEKGLARKNAEAANRDRERQVESAIQQQIGALMLAGMSEAAARAHVERSPKIRAMRSAANIYRTTAA
jgi:hypothetical protein